MKNALRIVAALAGLTGCATLRYHEPTHGPRARVRFVAHSDEVTVLRAYDDARCRRNETEWMRLREGFLVNDAPKTLGMPLWSFHANAAKEVFVEANKPLTAMFVGSRTDHFGAAPRSCATPFSYAFAEGADYEVGFRLAANECEVTISQLVRSADGWARSRLGRFGSQVNDANRECLQVSQVRHAY
jgi:hypothetical protein